MDVTDSEASMWSSGLPCGRSSSAACLGHGTAASQRAVGRQPKGAWQARQVSQPLASAWPIVQHTAQSAADSPEHATADFLAAVPGGEPSGGRSAPPAENAATLARAAL
eukprot:1332585-Pleurochrysis_carterae.AAC.1